MEAIRIEHGAVTNAELHNARIYRARKALFNIRDRWDVREMIDVPRHIAVHPGPVKCRLVYGEELTQIEYIPYTKKNIVHLHLVRADHIEYEHKFADRTDIEGLLEGFGPAEDIIMVQEGLVTDFSYGNLIFWDGFRWHTPAKPLLKGTKRQQMIDAGVVAEAEIKVEDLQAFRKCSLINCMLDPGSLEVPIANIRNALYDAK